MSFVEGDVNTLVGRTIVEAERIDGPGGWDEHESFALTLDDGRTALFAGWGYDAFGCSLYIGRVPK